MGSEVDSMKQRGNLKAFTFLNLRKTAYLLDNSKKIEICRHFHDLKIMLESKFHVG